MTISSRLASFFRTMGLIRMALGIMLVIDGLPLIFFVKETLRLAPGSTVFTALVMVLGFVLMLPFSFLRRFYRYNSVLMMFGVGAILYMIMYMFVFSSDMMGETGKDLIYFAYIFIFLFVLLCVPNDVIEVFIPVVIVFTLVSSVALVYALIRDPTWVIGQRAAIQFGEGEGRSGNPHTFARNALMCIIACGIWMSRPRNGFIMQLLTGLTMLFSAVILILTQTRSSVLALILVTGLFMFFNLRPVQIKQFVRGLARPLPLTFIVVLFLSIPTIIRYNYSLYSLVAVYAENFVNQNLDNIYALLGLKAQGAAYAATLDSSAANRGTSFGIFSAVIFGHEEKLIFGYGYKALYFDVPLMEALLTLGIFGFLLYGSFIAFSTYLSLRAMRYNFNPVSTFMAYFFMYLFVMQFTGGRPNEIAFWHPFCLMIRFVGVETLLPARLWSSPELARFWYGSGTEANPGQSAQPA
jgi:hypothetical protein